MSNILFKIIENYFYKISFFEANLIIDTISSLNNDTSLNKKKRRLVRENINFDNVIVLRKRLKFNKSAKFAIVRKLFYTINALSMHIV